MTDLDPGRRNLTAARHAVVRAPLSTVAACVVGAAMTGDRQAGMHLLAGLAPAQLRRLAWHYATEVVHRTDAAASATLPGEQHRVGTDGQAEGCNGAAARVAPHAIDQGEADQ